MIISEWLKHARNRLAQTSCPDPDIDARWIAEDVLCLTRQELVFEGDRAIPRHQLYRLEAMLDRRAAGEPVQYILGSADFMGLRFRVDGAVLIPRQDTETLVEATLIELRQRPGRPALLDLCAGSGCVGLSLASLAPNARITLADVSHEALEIARANQKDLGVKVELRQGDLFNAVGRERFDIIDGLDFYRRIAEGAVDHLNPGGAIFLEVGINEAQPVLELVKARLPCAQAGTVKDLNGVERVVFGKME